MREANFARADSLERLNPKFKPADTLLYDLAEAYKKDDVAQQEKLHAAIDKEVAQEKPPREDPIDLAIQWALLNSGDIADAERVMQRPRDAKRSGRAAGMTAWADGFVKLMRGRFREADKLLSSARPPGNTQVNADLAMEPFLTPSKAELEALRAQVARYDSVAGTGPGPRAQLRAQFRLYWLAMLNCRLGNTAEALDQAQRIESLPAPVYWQPAMQALATNVRAFADVSRGDVNQALARIESIPIDVPLDLMNTPAQRVEETLWRGELLYRAGRYDEALQWFENPAEWNQEAWPFFMLRRAQIYDRKGDAKQAASLYAQFLEYWKDPDPELMPLVQQAKSALAALQRKVD